MFGMMEIPQWVLDVPMTSFQLLVAGGALLICAAILLAVGRKTRVVMEHSVVTDELMAYLARIANALEGQRAPSSEEITERVVRRLQELSGAKPDGNVREMPFTLFERK